MFACIAAQLELTAHQDMKRLEARLKQLRSQAQIPPSASRNVGPNARYDLSELWKLVVVFEMIELSVDTLRAAMITDMYWPIIDMALANCWLSRQTHKNDPIFLQVFGGLVDGFTKSDKSSYKPLEWVNAEGRKQSLGKPLPLVWIDRMSILFSIESAGRLPPNNEFRHQTGCTLINLTDLVVRTASTMIETKVLTSIELDKYFKSKIEKPSQNQS
jgi:hypothetical protein